MPVKCVWQCKYMKPLITLYRVKEDITPLFGTVGLKTKHLVTALVCQSWCNWHTSGPSEAHSVPIVKAS